MAGTTAVFNDEAITDPTSFLYEKRMFGLQLRSSGFAIVRLPKEVTTCLTTASIAFGGQIAEWSQHGPPASFGGFDEVPGKQRIEYRSGSQHLADLGVLHSLADQVRSLGRSAESYGAGSCNRFSDLHSGSRTVRFTCKKMVKHLDDENWSGGGGI